MKKTLNTATNETFTTDDGRTVRFEEILEGIRKNVDIYRFKGFRDSFRNTDSAHDLQHAADPLTRAGSFVYIGVG